MFCRSCGEGVQPDVKFCEKCGTATQQAAAQPVQQPAQQVTQQPIPEAIHQYQQPLQPQYQQTVQPQAGGYYPQYPVAAGGGKKMALIIALIAVVLITAVTLVLVFTVFRGSSSSSDGDERFVGTWEDTLGMGTYVYRRDGTGTAEMFGMSLPFTWSVDGDRLNFTINFMGFSETEIMAFEFTNNNNTLRTWDPANPRVVEEFRRAR